MTNTCQRADLGPAPIFLALCVACLAVEAWMVHDFRTAIRVKSWPTAVGYVMESKLIEEFDFKKRYDVRISYTYEANGNSYSSSSVRPRGTATKYRFDAASTVDHFPAGADVPVYFNPSRPSESYLEAGVGWIDYITIISPLLFAGFFGAAFFSALKAQRITTRAKVPVASA